MTSHVDDNSSAPGARKGVGRRTITRGAAWSVPVIAVAVAAPAAANTSGGGCLTGKLDWDSCSGRTGLDKTLITAGGTGVTVMVTVGGDTSHSGNGAVTGTTTGGQSKVMRFYDENGVKNTSQTVTITFSSEVQNVSFSLLDVDSAISGRTREYEDEVRIISPASWSGSTHSNVTGSGTSNDPYRAVDTDSPVDGSSSKSNVDLTFAGPLTQIVFTYAQNGTVYGDPYIGISDIYFQHCD